MKGAENAQDALFPTPFLHRSYTTAMRTPAYRPAPRSLGRAVLQTARDVAQLVPSLRSRQALSLSKEPPLGLHSLSSDIALATSDGDAGSAANRIIT